MGYKNSRADMVKGYSKSIVLGGSNNLFPVAPESIEEFVKVIQDVISDAENAAYEKGLRDKAAEIKKALGLK